MHVEEFSSMPIMYDHNAFSFSRAEYQKMEIASWKIRAGMFDEKIQNRTGSKMKDKNSIQILNKRDLITPVTSL